MGLFWDPLLKLDDDDCCMCTTLFHTVPTSAVHIFDHYETLHVATIFDNTTTAYLPPQPQLHDHQGAVFCKTQGLISPPYIQYIYIVFQTLFFFFFSFSALAEGHMTCSRPVKMVRSYWTEELEEEAEYFPLLTANSCCKRPPDGPDRTRTRGVPMETPANHLQSDLFQI